ncbi:flagellar hook-basal body protein [Paenibacillus sp. NPDC058071]|uniref:flagellar hook-basal body protein n=1 Tax=Paenibacillus sp. NPDC058071 TaxID=3346326 RepID=UPI0036DDA016
MIRGLYTAAAGMMTQQRKHDTVTNNIANIMTPGYKQTTTVSRSFPEFMLSMTGVEPQESKEIGRMSFGVMAEEALAIYKQGDMQQTSRSTDFAILSNIEVPNITFDAAGKNVSDDGDVTYQPQAFFTLRNQNDEIRYTRGGTFGVTSDRYLVAEDGSNIMGVNNQPIRLPVGVTMDELVIDENRRLINAKTGAVVGEMLLTRVDNPYLLVREGTGNYRFTGEDNQVRPIAAAERVELKQGFIERSNVDAAQASVDLMAALRAYEANQKVVQAYDETLEKAVNQIGRI